MTKYELIDLKETLAISVNGECKYYQNCNDDYMSLCRVLNEQQEQITEQAIQIDYLKDENKHMRTVLEENKQLKEELHKLDTFKKILEYAEKDAGERADWQAYCEKEFGGL